MDEHDVLFEDIFPFLKENYRIMGAAGSFIGAVLVIFYGSKINYYPSGITISDTLFFLWVLIVAGLIYSIIFFIFFRASLFWIILFPTPIDWVFKKISKDNKIRVPDIKNRLWLVVEGTFLNILVLLYFLSAPSLSFAAMIIIVFCVIIVSYTCLTALLKKSEHKIIILPEKKDNISHQTISPSTGRLYFLFLIYFSPLLVGNFYLTDGIAKKTFQMMGVRIIAADIAIERNIFEDSLAQLKDDYLPEDSAQCSGDTCLLRDTTVLFTGIGNKTKLQVSGLAGSADIIIPNSAIKLIIKRKTKTI
ncbi:MAG: hypothetical protein D3922_01315 [Candidatus Electrothrix sp. AR1]|nr:hypothetical protein [Candidatus Electrothrix sp. AR1]